MRTLTLGVVLGILVGLPLCWSAGAQAQSGYTVITVAELKRMQDSGSTVVIIDTLAESAYKQGHIPGAKHFEFPNGAMEQWDKSRTAGRSQDDFLALLGGDKDAPLIFYCLDEK